MWVLVQALHVKKTKRMWNVSPECRTFENCCPKGKYFAGKNLLHPCWVGVQILFTEPRLHGHIQAWLLVLTRCTGGCPWRRHRNVKTHPLARWPRATDFIGSLLFCGSFTGFRFVYVLHSRCCFWTLRPSIAEGPIFSCTSLSVSCICPEEVIASQSSAGGDQMEGLPHCGKLFLGICSLPRCF